MKLSPLLSGEYPLISKQVLEWASVLDIRALATVSEASSKFLRLNPLTDLFLDLLALTSLKEGCVLIDRIDGLLDGWALSHKLIRPDFYYRYLIKRVLRANSGELEKVYSRFLTKAKDGEIEASDIGLTIFWKDIWVRTEMKKICHHCDAQIDQFSAEAMECNVLLLDDWKSYRLRLTKEMLAESLRRPFNSVQWTDGTEMPRTEPDGRQRWDFIPRAEFHGLSDDERVNALEFPEHFVKPPGSMRRLLRCVPNHVTPTQVRGGEFDLSTIPLRFSTGKQLLQASLYQCDECWCIVNPSGAVSLNGGHFVPMDVVSLETKAEMKLIKDDLLDLMRLTKPWLWKLSETISIPPCVFKNRVITFTICNGMAVDARKYFYYKRVYLSLRKLFHASFSRVLSEHFAKYLGTDFVFRWLNELLWGCEKVAFDMRTDRLRRSVAIRILEPLAVAQTGWILDESKKVILSDYSSLCDYNTRNGIMPLKPSSLLSIQRCATSVEVLDSFTKVLDVCMRVRRITSKQREIRNVIIDKYLFNYHVIDEVLLGKDYLELYEILSGPECKFLYDDPTDTSRGNYTEKMRTTAVSDVDHLSDYSSFVASETRHGYVTPNLFLLIDHFFRPYCQQAPVRLPPSLFYKEECNPRVIREARQEERRSWKLNLKRVEKRRQLYGALKIGARVSEVEDALSWPTVRSQKRNLGAENEVQDIFIGTVMSRKKVAKQRTERCTFSSEDEFEEEQEEEGCVDLKVLESGPRHPPPLRQSNETSKNCVENSVPSRVPYKLTHGLNRLAIGYVPPCTKILDRDWGGGHYWLATPGFRTGRRRGVIAGRFVEDSLLTEFLPEDPLVEAVRIPTSNAIKLQTPSAPLEDLDVSDMEALPSKSYNETQKKNEALKGLMGMLGFQSTSSDEVIIKPKGVTEKEYTPRTVEMYQNLELEPAVRYLSTRAKTKGDASERHTYSESSN